MKTCGVDLYPQTMEKYLKANTGLTIRKRTDQWLRKIQEGQNERMTAATIIAARRRNPPRSQLIRGPRLRGEATAGLHDCCAAHFDPGQQIQHVMYNCAANQQSEKYLYLIDCRPHERLLQNAGGKSRKLSPIVYTPTVDWLPGYSHLTAVRADCSLRATTGPYPEVLQNWRAKTSG
jgi:hypothetical protein